MYDLAIIGAGPAGLTAGIYGVRAGFNTVIIDFSDVGGGQVLTTYEVDNYPGLPGISGFDLGMKLKEHAEGAGVSFIEANVTGLDVNNSIKKILTDSESIEARAIIIATGATHNHLDIPGEEELAGMGVSYCATCDGAFFKNRITAVIGGGDVALEDALFLARACSKVYLIHRRDSFRGANTLQEAVKNSPNIEIIYDTVVESIGGSDQVESLHVKNTKNQRESDLAVDGVFIAVGTHPTTDYIKGIVDMTDSGYVIAGEDCKTNVPGVFVAGDARTKALRQIITAAADGANAVNSVSEYLVNN